MGSRNWGALPRAWGDPERVFCLRSRTPWSEHQRALGSRSGERWTTVGKSNGAVCRKAPAAPAKSGREYSATAFHNNTAARQRCTEILLCYASGFPFASRRSSPVLCPRSSVHSTEPHRPLRPTTANLGHINNLHLVLGRVLLRHRLTSFVRGVGVAGPFIHRPVRRSVLRPRILASSACWQTLQTPAAPQVTRRSLDTQKTYERDDGSWLLMIWRTEGKD